MNRMNRIRFTRNRQNVCFFGGIILAGNRARPAVSGNHASKNWNGLSKMSELFTASSLALTSMDSSLPSVVLITEDPLSSCPPKSYICVDKIKRRVSSTNLCMRASFRRLPALHRAVSSTNNSSSSSFKANLYQNINYS